MPVPTCVPHDRPPDQVQSKKVLPDETRVKNRLIGPCEFRREHIPMKKDHEWTVPHGLSGMKLTREPIDRNEWSGLLVRKELRSLSV